MIKNSKEPKDNNLNVQTVQIGKLMASFLVPDYNDGQKLAVIDEGVLKYLKSLLPRASAREIVQDFRDIIMDLLKMDHPNTILLERTVSAAKDFVAFHEAVNLMSKYFDPSAVITREAPFNVPEPEPTVKEMFEGWVKLGNNLKDAVGQYGEGYETLSQFEEMVMKSHTSVVATADEVERVVEVIQPKVRPVAK